jgi:hypothetical protein
VTPNQNGWPSKTHPVVQFFLAEFPASGASPDENSVRNLSPVTFVLDRHLQALRQLLSADLLGGGGLQNATVRQGAGRTDLHQLLLDLDLKKVGRQCLPDDINRIDGKLKGPCVLQVKSRSFVSASSVWRSHTDSVGRRVPLLRVTDAALAPPPHPFGALLLSCSKKGRPGFAPQTAVGGVRFFEACAAAFRHARWPTQVRGIA